MEKVLHMVGGVGKYSYFANSLLQRKALMKAKPVIKEAVREISWSEIGSRDIINIADMGCSHGPNTLMLIREVLVTVGDVYPKATSSKRWLPDTHFFLNDLPGNDFNSLFRSIASLCSDLYGEDANGSVPPLYAYGAPGSFFGRILPRNSMHLVHSSYSLHFLSQIPRGLQVGEISNKRNIYLSNASPESVVKAYVDRFKKDFSLFLVSRAEELVHGGLMVLTFLGRNSVHPSAAELDRFWQPLSEALGDMVNEGLVEEADLEKFNLPLYTPSLEEVKAIVEDEGSFSLEQATSFQLDWDPLLEDYSTKGVDLDLITSGENVANYTRAVVGPLLLKHFKDINIDDVFERFAKKISVIPKGAQKHVHVLFKLKKIQPS